MQKLKFKNLFIAKNCNCVRKFFGFFKKEKKEEKGKLGSINPPIRNARGSIHSFLEGEKEKEFTRIAIKNNSRGKYLRFFHDGRIQEPPTTTKEKKQEREEK